MPLSLSNKKRTQPIIRHHSNDSYNPDTRPAAPELIVSRAAGQVKCAKKVIVLPTMEGLCFEKVKHITHLEANGNYTTLHFADGRQVLVCKSLCEVEAQLPTDAFVRLHRSHTVHLRHLKKYVRGKGGHVILQNGASLSVSFGQKDHFMTMLKTYFEN
jgi:two-component system, LytTR family, response regulator